MTKNEPQISRSDHVFIAGSTGSGKSVLAEIYLAGSNFPYVAKLDTKGEYFERKEEGKPIWRGLEEDKDFKVVFYLKDLEYIDTPKVIYVPEPEEQTPAFYDAFFKWCYERKNTTVWVDELMSVADGPHKTIFWLKSLMTRGRSRNCGVWNCTQRPTEIPNIILANSTVFFIFSLLLPKDREKIMKITDQQEFMIKPQKHYFWYFKIGNTKPILATLRLKG